LAADLTAQSFSFETEPDPRNILNPHDPAIGGFNRMMLAGVQR
jgi:hypothetical protein